MTRTIAIVAVLVLASGAASSKENPVTPLQGAPASERPPIDLEAPKEFETATFALG